MSSSGISPVSYLLYYCLEMFSEARLSCFGMNQPLTSSPSSLRLPSGLQSYSMSCTELTSRAAPDRYSCFSSSCSLKFKLLCSFALFDLLPLTLPLFLRYLRFDLELPASFYALLSIFLLDMFSSDSSPSSCSPSCTMLSSRTLSPFFPLRAFTFSIEEFIQIKLFTFYNSNDVPLHNIGSLSIISTNYIIV